MVPSELVLPEKQGRLYRELQGKGDVAISTLYGALFDGVGGDQRHQQQILGSFITKLNRRLKVVKQVVRPGRLKGTYCIERL